MANRVDCRNCGTGVSLPAGYARAKIRCPGCGHYAEVPPELRGLEGEEEVAPPAPPVPAARPKRAEPVVAQRAVPSAPAEPPAPKPKPNYADDEDEYDGVSKYGFADPAP